MSFSSVAFLVFFSIVLGLMALTNTRPFRNAPRIRAFRQGILLAASYVFYGWWDWRFCFLMLALTLIAWCLAIQIETRRMRRYAVLGVVAPLLILGVFKYCNFFIASFAAVFGISNIGALHIMLPVGVSFYTFQSMTYTIDVYSGKVLAEKNFVKIALYIAFFPQLVAGPIIKAADFLPQLEEDRRISAANFLTGIQIIVFGLGKKIVLADRLSVFVDDVFRTPKAFHAVSLMLAVIAYSMQIYFDFSGYSDMATGCAKCLGYDFSRNFNLPYISRNMSEFWRRWHISLSSWLREYLYIPLGGNRKGPARTYLNQMLTMLLGGLWHGANWTFVLWGGAHGVALCVHKGFARHFTKKTPCPKSRVSAALCFLAANMASTIFVCLCWVFFRADSFSTALRVIVGIFTW
jgi:alginate O-acetyltransferase complex protein AlgI